MANFNCSSNRTHRDMYATTASAQKTVLLLNPVTSVLKLLLSMRVYIMNTKQENLNVC